MKATSTLTQMTLALVALAGTLVLLADLFLGVLPDRGAQQRELRRHVAETVAVQVAEELRTGDAAAIERLLRAVGARIDGLRSIGLRRSRDDALLAQAGEHARLWQPMAGERSVEHQILVPLSASAGRWGSLELSFAPDERPFLLRHLTQPLTLVLLFFSSAGSLVFWLYMRRALQHLDPASVIPERVQGAFDAMAEGVVVLDARARVLLANKAFRALHDDAELRVGSALSALPWLSAGLPPDLAQHPWTRAMSERAANAGTTIEVDGGDGDGGQRRQLVVNAAPICDVGGRARGCLATFSDVTALHQANAALRDAMQALSVSNAEVERKNRELHELATRDPLTGCLNRRALDASILALRDGAGGSALQLGCIMVDIDHFKRVNDQHGHGVGDRVIQEVAKKLHECARSTDLVCRFGGEEFCVVVPGVGIAEMLAFGERVRERIEREGGPAVREVQGLRVTASVGADAGTLAGQGIGPMIERADQALYAAKRGGRNQVRAFTEAEPQTGSAAQAAPTGVEHA
ncbi:MAG: diguanylate cyclase [Rubrivivax sp.]|nr:diguanylate cyclase [Rubrivivax sp.]